MAEILPAILPKDYAELKEKLALLAGETALVHIDISDASLGGDITWPYSDSREEWERIKREEAGFPSWEEMNFEAHLMLKDPEAAYEDWIRAGAERIIAHYEAFDSDEAVSSFFQKFIEHFEADQSLKVEVGLAVALDTPISRVADHVLECDFIHLMSIAEIGAQGRAFDERIFDKITELRSLYPETIISIDGGVSVENAARLVEAGVERLCVGSAVWQAEDPLEALEDLIAEVE